MFFILPYYLLDLYRPIRALRSANKLHLDIPKSRLKTKGDQALQWLPLSCGMGYRRISGRQKLWTFLNPLLKLTFSPRLSDLGETNVVFVCHFILPAILVI